MTAALAGFGILQAVIYLLFVRSIDLYEREAFRYVLPVFVWGFTVAAVASLIFNSIFSFTIATLAGSQAASFLTAVFVAPVTEETTKGLALLITFVVVYVIALRGRAIAYSGVMDGIVYGSAVGFGFSLAEDLIYFAQYGPEVFVMRRIFGGFGHAAFTSLTGIGIGLIPWVRYGVLKALLPLAGLAAAILVHAVFNFTSLLLGGLAYVLMFLLVLFYIGLIIGWLAVERRTIREELREEVASGTISTEEYEVAPTYFRRTFHSLKLLFSGRLAAWKRVRKVHQATIDLAFTKRLARRSYAPPQGERIEALRKRIHDLRRAPEAATL
jgi:RsiW-degrading membrane proteinase PrsW (M82 family)